MTPLHSKWDVIVIGAGPAGSNAAYHLALQGWKVLLIEKQRSPGITNACGGVAFAKIRDQLSLPKELCEKEIRKILFSYKGTTIRKTTQKPAYLSFTRRNFDSFLAQRAVRKGAMLLKGMRVRGRQDDKIYAINHLTGEQTTHQGKIVIYADGAPTLAWKHRHIGFALRYPFHEALVYELEAPKNSEESFHFHLNPDQVPFGCFWIFPKKDMLNVGIARLRESSNRPLKALLREFCRRHPTTEGKPLRSVRTGIIPAHLAAAFHDHNSMVVGDAAGFTDPVTGAGIQPGLRSGELAAFAAHAALQKRHHEGDALASYPKLLKRSTDYLWIRFWGSLFEPLSFMTLHVYRGCYGRILPWNFALALYLYKKWRHF